MVFVSRVESSSFLFSFFFFFFSSMDDLALNDVTLILGANMDVDMSIETHIKYDKLLILIRKKSDKGAYLKFVPKPKNNNIKINNKKNTQGLNSNKIKI
jgi:hypothetical protein